MGASELLITLFLFLVILKLKLLVPVVEDAREKATDQDDAGAVDGGEDPQQVGYVVLALRPGDGLVEHVASFTDYLGHILGAHEVNNVDQEENQRSKVRSEQWEPDVVLLDDECENKHAENDTTEGDLYDVKNLNGGEKVQGL